MSDSSLFIRREPVLDAWVDYNGHLSEPYYVLAMSNATDAILDAVGMGEEYRSGSGSSFYTVELHVRLLAEVRTRSDLEVRSWIIGCTAKAAHIWHELWVDGTLRATEEVLGVHVTGTSSSPFPPAIADCLRTYVVEPPTHAGRAIRLRDDVTSQG
ncbi:thioesterase family protein [Nocardioides sp. J9]|uniref:thioesterase family protein n=1 Tax=Nocardioides sp. J9 TaxID=935844 RepID=UPI0011A3364E